MLDYQILDQVRTTNPVVVTFANIVTPQSVANAVNVIGGSPIMSLEPTEAHDLVSIAHAVTLNMGTANGTDHDFAELSALGQSANELGVPVILDPVAVNVPFRSSLVEKLAKVVKFDIIRGNASEIAYFANIQAESRGIDASGEVDIELVATEAAKKTGAIIVLTGATDIITDGTRVFKVTNGSSLLAANVGSGDMLSSVIGTFQLAGVDRLEGAAIAAVAMGLAGELAGQAAENQPGTFSAKLLDELYQLTPEKLVKYGKVEEINA